MKNYLIIFFCCFISIKSNAQSIERAYPDAGWWNTINLSSSINKKWTLLFTEEIRFRENITRLNLFYNNIGAEYNFNNYISTSFTYRNIQKYLQENRFSIRHRIMWDVDVKYPIEKFTLRYRSRVQTEERNINSSDANDPEWFWRNKIGIGYKINKKWSTYLATELRIQFFDPRNIEYNAELHRFRYQAGLTYKINKRSTFETYYLIQKEFGIAGGEDQYIVGLEFNHKLPDMKNILNLKKKKNSN